MGDHPCATTMSSRTILRALAHSPQPNAQPTAPSSNNKPFEGISCYLFLKWSPNQRTFRLLDEITPSHGKHKYSPPVTPFYILISTRLSIITNNYFYHSLLTKQSKWLTHATPLPVPTASSNATPLQVPTALSCATLPLERIAPSSVTLLPVRTAQSSATLLPAPTASFSRCFHSVFSE